MILKPGDRIELLSMPEDPDPIPAGTTGTVVSVQEMDWGGKKNTQVTVDWDVKRSLSLVMPPDRVRLIDG